MAITNEASISNDATDTFGYDCILWEFSIVKMAKHTSMY